MTSIKGYLVAFNLGSSPTTQKLKRQLNIGYSTKFLMSEQHVEIVYIFQGGHKLHS